ncbi:MAG: glycosyltransferase family 4 protein [Bacteroidota bacterium]
MNKIPSIPSISPNQTKVLHIITTFSLGGATENTLFSVEGLKSLGYNVWILAGPSNAGEGDLFDRAREKGIRVEIVPRLMRSIHPWNDFLALVHLTQILRREKVHIVHTHSSKAGILGRVAAFLARTPVVVHTIHGLPFHEYQGRILYTLFRWVEKMCGTMSDKLISVTDTIKEKALQAGVGKPEQFVTVRSGFAMEEFARPGRDRNDIRREFGLKGVDLVVGKIARFSPLKGHQYLLDAVPSIVAQVPNARFLLVGGGELETTYREMVKQRGIENSVLFAGLVPLDRMAEVISVMDIVVHTSLLEGLARVLPQALAAGKPVVSFDIDGAHEVVLQGKTGLLVEPENEEDLSKAIVKLLLDRKKAVQFGVAGAQLVRDQWTTEAMVRGIHSVYQDLLTKKAITK